MNRVLKAVGFLILSTAMAAVTTPASASSGASPHDTKSFGVLSEMHAEAEQVQLSDFAAQAKQAPSSLARLKQARTARLKTAKSVRTTDTIRGRALHRSLLKSAAVTGISATGALILPFTDGIGDSVTLTYATDVLADYFSSTPGTYSMAITDSTSAVVRSIGDITADSVLVDPNCDFYNFSCDYRDVLSFTWDGKNDAAVDVVVGDYTVTQGGTAVGTVTVHNFALTGVTGPTGTTYLAPLPDGVLDSVSVNVAAHTYGNVPVTSTGQAELRDGSGSVLQSIQLTDPVATHPVLITAPPVGIYSLVVTLSSQSQTTSATFAVSSVPTSLTATNVGVDTTNLFPFVDGYRDTLKVSVTSTTSVHAAVPVTGSLTVKKGSSSIATIPISMSTQAITWDGRVNGKVVPGSYSVTARIKAAEGAWQQSPPKNVTVSSTVTGAPSINVPYTTVFPSHDGYRDILPISASSKLSSGRAGAGSIVVEVKSGSRSVHKWTFSGTGAHVANWNGKVGSSITSGKYSIIVTAKGPEGVAKTTSKFVTVSGKKLVSHTAVVKKVYLSSTARDDCGGAGYRPCADGQRHTISGTTFSDVTEYYTGDINGDIMWSAQSLPLPAGTTSYRLSAVADVYDAQYVLGYCYSDSTNPDDCPSGAGGYFPLNSEGGFTFPWTSVGASDGVADFFIGSVDWGFLYVAGYQVEAKRTWKTLQ